MKTLELRKEIIDSYMERWTRNIEMCQLCIPSWKMNTDGKIDVIGNVWINDNLTKFPFSFGNIKGMFHMKYLKMLDGFPTSIYSLSYFNSKENSDEYRKICDIQSGIINKKY